MVTNKFDSRLLGKGAVRNWTYGELWELGMCWQGINAPGAQHMEEAIGKRTSQCSPMFTKISDTLLAAGITNKRLRYIPLDERREVMTALFEKMGWPVPGAIEQPGTPGLHIGGTGDAQDDAISRLLEQVESQADQIAELERLYVELSDAQRATAARVLAAGKAMSNG